MIRANCTAARRAKKDAHQCKSIPGVRKVNENRGRISFDSTLAMCVDAVFSSEERPTQTTIVLLPGKRTETAKRLKDRGYRGFVRCACSRLPQLVAMSGRVVYFHALALPSHVVMKGQGKETKNTYPWD